MKKIAYIEVDTHAEIARNFLELMKGSSEFAVDYYFSEKILKQIGKHQTNIFVTESSMLLNQLKNENYDLIIIGTVHRYFNVLGIIAREYNTAIIVHNLKFTGISSFHLFRNILKKDFAYRLKLMLKESLLSASKVYQKGKNLLVLDENLSSKKLIFLPVFFNEFIENMPSAVFTVVIPGAVSQRRRDYVSVLKKITHFRNNFKIVFLGKATGKELKWLTTFEKNKPENISIEYFTEKVPQHIFDEWMQRSNVLWCPVQKKTEFFSNPEIYGKTKMSGNLGDAIKYGKMAIFPKDYDLTRYPFLVNENEEVEKQLLDLSKMEFNFQETFSRKKIAADLHTVLNSLV
ncbi:MAG: hypothetical protein K0M63_07375 [Weeksellaceae bacterium]|nr:hypothetical protein [Weeksellaceae bacterium]